MKRTRRDFLQGAAVIGAGALAPATLGVGSLAEARQGVRGIGDEHRARPGDGSGFRAVVTPDVPDLAFEMDGSVKVFHLVAEPVRQVAAWGVRSQWS